jgi:hypothetical protein
METVQLLTTIGSANSGAEYPALCQLPCRAGPGVQGNEARLGKREGLAFGEPVS